MIAYLGLGANLGDRLANLREAIRRLEDAGCRVIARSSVYETEPVGITDQPDFLNAVIKVETSLTARDLLNLCKSIENEMGRVRTNKWSPRVIDIDILLYDDSSVCEDDLVIPHAEMLKRAFVLIPLAEIAPGVMIAPGLNAREASVRVDREGVRRFDGSI
ncbi:MAG: 2-amino-4-hydroxy-6-hydroxymethyldihydropteridine diphosphokinase [Armatimonadetes bacterium]|nr:2-amino-4-hydroxy-6-hydroxymethyldihydropteridine diphosphokinase [Armatimonadota bacterium]